MWASRLGALLLLVACAGPARPAADSAGGAPAGPKRIVVAIASEPPSARSQLSRGSGAAVPGSKELEQLLHAGLTVEDHHGVLRPQLADAVPSLDNGLWRLLPEGRMETTWHIRPSARWQDGVPFTADDILFTAQLAQDREFPNFRQTAYDLIEGIDAADPYTITVRWKQPFIEADTLFAAWGVVQAMPSPRHLLGAAYLENRSGLLNLPYWREEFIGAGPFKLREWVQGSHLTLEAFAGYALGRPRLDEIVIRVIPDPSTLVANILAEVVDTHVGRGLSLEQTIQIRDQWRSGRVDFTPGGAIKVWPQLHAPNPAVVGDAPFRRALLHAVDREQLTDVLMYGLSSVAHSILIPDEQEFGPADPSAVRYAYDTRRAQQLIEGLGYGRGVDGMLRDPAGQPLSVEARSVVVDVLQKTVQSMADYWRRIGVAVETQTIPPARQGDREYRATYPAFDASRGNNSAESFKTFLSSEARVRETGFAGQNYPSYANADLDRLIERYLVTIPFGERMEMASGIVRHMSEQAIVLPMFYDVLATVTASRLQGVPLGAAQGRSTTWNAQDWDLAAP